MKEGISMFLLLEIVAPFPLYLGSHKTQYSRANKRHNFFLVWGAHILRIDFTSNDNIEYFIMTDWAKCGNGSSLAAIFLNPIFLCEFAHTTKVSEYLCMSFVK